MFWRSRMEHGFTVAVLNAKDIAQPEDLADAAAWTWIKMAEFSVEGP